MKKQDFDIFDLMGSSKAPVTKIKLEDVGAILRVNMPVGRIPNIIVLSETQYDRVIRLLS